jgi:Tol biopolymer transport system component
LWLRSLDAPAAQPLAGTDGGRLPFWSPDSRSIGFFADGRLRRMDIDGGSPTILATAPYGRGGAWNRDGTILFAPSPAAEPLSRISSSGGEAQRIGALAPRTVSHSVPRFLPDGRHFLYHVDGAADLRGTYVATLDHPAGTRLFESDSAAVFAAGRLFFVRQATLYAQPFDPARQTLSGEPTAIAENIVSERGSAAFTVSDGGTIVYRTGAGRRSRRQFTWFDLSGKESGVVGDPADDLIGISLSPDDRRLAFFTRESGNADIWLLDTVRGVRQRLTSDVGDDLFPTWSTDSTQIAFSSTRNQSLDLYLKPASGIGEERLLLATPEAKAISDWSRDGRFLIFSVIAKETGFDIWSLPMQGERKPFRVVQSSFNERLAQLSPNGKWIAYESNESGQYEIYIQPFFGSERQAETKVIVSRSGGTQVRWRADGKALFYLALDGRLMSVPVTEPAHGGDIEPGVPVPLFAARLGGVQPFPSYQYSVSADGRRFLLAAESDGSAVSTLAVILNWTGLQQ